MANKNSEFADNVRCRKEQDDHDKEMAAQMEALRIERQHAENQHAKHTNLKNIKTHQEKVFN